MIAVDANALVALLVDDGTLGSAGRSLYIEHDLAAPDLLPYEVISVLRKLSQRGTVTERVAEQALRDLSLVRLDRGFVQRDRSADLGTARQLVGLRRCLCCRRRAPRHPFAHIRQSHTSLAWAELRVRRNLTDRGPKRASSSSSGASVDGPT